MKKTLWVLIPLLLIGGAYYAYPRLQPKEEIKILETTTADRGDIRGVLMATGIIKPQLSWRAFAAALPLSWLVGILAGIYPSKRAAAIRPVDIIRS